LTDRRERRQRAGDGALSLTVIRTDFLLKGAQQRAFFVPLSRQCNDSGRVGTRRIQPPHLSA